MKVTQSSVASGEAVGITRSNELDTIRKRLSADDEDIQLIIETKIIYSEMRKELVRELDFSVTIPADQSLAMKTDLGIPWRKLRMTRRYII